MTTRYCLSRVWLLETEDDCPRLRRPSDGAVVELEGAPTDLLEALWTALVTPRAEAELEGLFGPLAELVPLFLDEGMLRPASERRDVSLTGGGALREVVAELLNEAPWSLPPLLCLAGASGFDAAAGTDAVAMALVGDSVVAMRAGCPSCLLLRALGRVGEPGAEQTALLDAAPALEDRDLRALVATALGELERTALEPFHGLSVRSDAGLALGRVLRHPDCVRCGPARRDYGPAWLRRDLTSDGQPATVDRIRAVFADSPFAPLEIGEVAAARAGDFPFDAPYVSGDTRLSRRWRGRVFNTSIPGIAHGSASSAERSRLLAWSEGVERLAAQGATADLILARDDPRVNETCELYGWRPSEIGARDTAWCLGLDLLRDQQCLVPFGRVGVALPEPLCPDGVAIDSAFTGTASHVTSLQGILHASVELLKRDAFMVAWYRQRRLARVTLPSSLPPEVSERLAYIERHGLKLDLFDLRADLPLPMLLADVRAVRRVGQWPEGGAVLVPAGGFTPLDALGHLLTLICTRFVGLGLDDSPERDPLDPVAVAELGKRIAFWPALARYLDPARGAALEFLRGQQAIPLDSMGAGIPEAPRERLPVLCSWLREAGLNLIAVPLTDDHVLEAGLRAVKVIVPEAVRLTLRHDAVDAEQPRFARQFPGAEPGSWNRDPHPVY